MFAALLTLLILLGIAAAWLVIVLVHARRQSQVADKLRDLGALVAYDYHIDGGFKAPSREQVREGLLAPEREVLGKDLFHDIVSVVFTPVPDKGNPTMLYDPDGYVYLAERQVADDDLRILGSLSALRILRLEGIPITDRAIAHLEKLTSLEELNVRNTHITSDGVRRLKRALPDCDVLD